jgi:hypothetical protein
MVGINPRSFVKYHDQLKNPEDFFNYKSSAEYINTFQGSVFEYYNDAPDVLNLRKTMTDTMNRSTLVFLAVEIAGDNDQAHREQKVAELVEGLSDEEKEKVELIITTARKMQEVFTAGSQSNQQQDALNQHKQLFTKLIDTVMDLDATTIESGVLAENLRTKQAELLDKFIATT